jgi:hypothetical protein
MNVGTRFAKLAVIFLAALSFAGCAQQKLSPLGGVSSVTMVNIENDHYKSLSEKYNGEQTIEIRTFNSEGGDTWTAAPEITGANCELKHEYFTASVVTPHAIRVPLYGSQTRQFSVTCAKNGYQQTVQVVSPYNVSQANRRSAGSQGGLLGVLIAEMINSASDPEDDQFEYTGAAVTLVPVLKQEDPVPEEKQLVAESDGS